MRKIFTLLSLFVFLITFAQENCDTMFIYRNNNIERILVSEIDSITFVSPSVKAEEVPSFLAPGKPIDLGLPSGIKWASCNVGASSPEMYGCYYAWGETEEKNDYSWETYKWCKGTYNTMTKYCTINEYGTIDNKTVLEPADDVAHVKWGAGWRMPTKDEVQELIDNCTWEWTSVKGVNGYMVTGPNGKSIFLPAAGNCKGTNVNNKNTDGFYWSASLVGYSNNYADYLDFDNSYYGWGSSGRSHGRSVRPVIE